MKSFLLLIPVLLAGCAAPRVDSEWTRVEPPPSPIAATLVLVEAGSLVARRYLESALGRELGERGIVARPAHRRPELADAATDEVIGLLTTRQEAAAGDSVDAILIARISVTRRRERVVDPYLPYTDPFRHPWSRGGWTGVYGPAYTVVDTTVVIDVQLLAADDASPLWSATIRSRNPSSSDQLARELADTVAASPGPGDWFVRPAPDHANLPAD